MGLAAAAGGGGGGGAAFTVLLLAALVGALALVPPPPGERVRAVQKKLSSLLSSSRLERPGSAGAIPNESRRDLVAPA